MIKIVRGYSKRFQMAFNGLSETYEPLLIQSLGGARMVSRESHRTKTWFIWLCTRICKSAQLARVFENWRLWSLEDGFRPWPMGMAT